jgi:hypothetical protein
MAGDRDAEVDPRFDPVFQRGYDPKVHGERRARAVPRHGTGPVNIETFREPAVPAAAEPAPPESSAPSLAVAPAPGPSSTAAAATDLTLQARNPFRLALLIASVVSIGVAALMIWNRIGEDVYYGGFSGTDVPSLFRSQLFGAAPVPLLTGGMLGLILWLAIGAMAHRARTDE